MEAGFIRRRLLACWHADESLQPSNQNLKSTAVRKYNERWQQVATYRQADGSNIDTHPRDAGRTTREQFVNHAAGLAGHGSSSYIDGVILRDDQLARVAASAASGDDRPEAADSTPNPTGSRRVDYCQNRRADVIATLPRAV